MEEESTSETAGPVAHNNVALFTVRSSSVMDRLLSEPGLRGLIWHRLDATRAIVDPTSVGLLHERLRSLGISVSVGDLSFS